MSTDLQYLVILTGANCAACRALHNTGSFSRTDGPRTTQSLAGFQWEPTSFWKLATASDKVSITAKIQYSVIEIELFDIKQPMNYSNIKSFTQFTAIIETENDVKQPYIERDIYDRTDDKTDTFTYTKDNGDTINEQEMKGSFDAFLAKNYPLLLANYARQFPSFLYMSNGEFKKALSDPQYAPYVRCFSLMTGKLPNDTWGITGKDVVQEVWKQSLYSYAKHLADNPDLLIPVSVNNSAATTSAAKSVVSKRVTIAPILKKSGDVNTDNISSTSIDNIKSTTNPNNNNLGYKIKVMPLRTILPYHAY